CNPKQLYHRYDEWTCRAYTNVLQGARWMVMLVQAYTSKQSVVRGDCLKFAGGDSVAQSIMDALRELEASAGRAQRSRLTLTGQIEMDATVLRSFKVGPASQAYAAEIQ
ncbi:unnamed protein product, partial [Effrenium voratum]